MLDKLLQGKDNHLLKDAYTSSPMVDISKDWIDTADIHSESDIDVLDLYAYQDDNNDNNENDNINENGDNNYNADNNHNDNHDNAPNEHNAHNDDNAHFSREKSIYTPNSDNDSIGKKDIQVLNDTNANAVFTNIITDQISDSKTFLRNLEEDPTSIKRCNNNKSATKSTKFKVKSHSVSTEFKNKSLLSGSGKHTTDSGANNSLINTQKLQDNSVKYKPKNLTDHIKNENFTYDKNPDNMNSLGIDESILEIIDKLGKGLDFDNELQINVLPEITSINSNKDNNVISPCTNVESPTDPNFDTNFDLLSIQISSDDNYDEDERFDTFFNLNDNTTHIAFQPTNQTNEGDVHDALISADETCCTTNETFGPANETFGMIHDLQTPFPFTSAFLPSDDPPPYSEVHNYDENARKFHEASIDSTEPYLPAISNNSNLLSSIAETSPTKSNTSANSDNSSPLLSNYNTNKLKKRISIKLRKSSNGELSRKASVDYYQMDKYLLPYRSLINPNKVYDYRTNSYIDTNNNGIEIKSDLNNNTVVSIYKKKKSDNKLMSMLITTNNNLKQKLLDAGDTLSIKSIKTVKSYKATAKFKDLNIYIQKRIISLIDNQKDLVNCLYVSKSFNEFVLPNLYKYPKFTSTYRLGQFIYSIINNEKLSSYVKVLDLSKITYPIALTPFEIQKYKGKLIFGSSVANDLLNDKSRVIYAGWRDWKYRKHTLYGDIKRTWRKRANSSSTISSDSTLVRIDSSISSNSNKSTPNLLKSNNSSITLVNSKTRSNSVSTSEQNGSKTRKRSNSSNDVFKKSSKNIPSNMDKKNIIKLQKSSAVAAIKSKKSKKTVNIEETPKIRFDNIPFGTPHPKMNSLLKQYCFNKDIPVGYIIHILKECKYLTEINFDGITISTDYELLDYETFDWVLCSGKSMNYGTNPKSIDPSRPIFSSDIGDEIEFNDKIFINGFAKIVEFKNIWDIIMNLDKIEVLKLSRINWLEQSIILNFVMHSDFKDNLKYLDCSSSGMVKRDEWDKLKDAAEWRNYFQTV